MYQTIDNHYQFEQAFKEAGRGEQFSRNGLDALFDYLEEYEDSTGEKIELDVIALCCEYSEYESAQKAAEEYGYEDVAALEERSYDLLEVEELNEAQALEWLQDRTQVITFSGGIIIQQF